MLQRNIVATFQTTPYQNYRIHLRGTKEILKVYKHGYSIVLEKLIWKLGAEYYKISTESIYTN